MKKNEANDFYLTITKDKHSNTCATINGGGLL